LRWYHRPGVDLWMLGACERHGAELVELGFVTGPSARFQHVDDVDMCAMCVGATTMAYVRACRCRELGTPAPATVDQEIDVDQVFDEGDQALDEGDQALAVDHCSHCGAELAREAP